MIVKFVKNPSLHRNHCLYTKLGLKNVKSCDVGKDFSCCMRNYECCKVSIKATPFFVISYHVVGFGYPRTIDHRHGWAD